MLFPYSHDINVMYLMFHFNLQHWEKFLWYIRQRPSMRYLFEHACLLGCYAILNSKYQHSERSQFLHFLGQTVKEEWLVLNCLSPKWLFTPCSLVNSYWLECLHLHSQAVQGHPWPLSRLSWHNIPKEFNLHQNCCQNLKSHKHVSPV